MSYTESLYVILGVEEDASEHEIKQAYKKAALRTHPDRALPERKAEAEANFKKVAEAYEILSEPTSRRRYDRFGTPSSPPPQFRNRSAAGGTSGSAGSGNNTFFGVSPDSKPFSFQWESSYDSARRAQQQRGNGSRRAFGIDPFQLFNEMFEREFRSGGAAGAGGGGFGGSPGLFDDHPFFANHRRMADTNGFGFGAMPAMDGFGGMGGGGFDSPFASHGSNSMAATRRDHGGAGLIDPFSMGSSTMSSMMSSSTMSGMMGGGGGVGGSGQFQSESRSTRTINGQTETVIRKVDGQGNETVHTISPQGQRVLVNGVEAPNHPLLQQGPQGQPAAGALPAPSGSRWPF